MSDFMPSHEFENTCIKLFLTTELPAIAKCEVTTPTGDIRTMSAWLTKPNSEFGYSVRYPEDFEGPPGVEVGNYLVRWIEPAQDPEKSYVLCSYGFRTPEIL